MYLVSDLNYVSSSDLKYVSCSRLKTSTPHREMKLQYCVYVLYSHKDDGLYIGFTEDLGQRLTDHFNGNNKSTVSRRPFSLIHCEYFLSKHDALYREKYLKTSVGRRGLKLIIEQSLKDVKK